MPEMNGYEATAAIRRGWGDAARRPVMAMTAGAMAGERKEGLAVGMDHFRAKPITIEGVEGVLRRWVGLRSTTTGAACPAAQAPRSVAELEHLGEEVLPLLVRAPVAAGVVGVRAAPREVTAAVVVTVVIVVVPARGAELTVGSVEDLVELATVEPHAPALGAVVHLDAAALAHLEGLVVDRAVHGTQPREARSGCGVGRGCGG